MLKRGGVLLFSNSSVIYVCHINVSMHGEQIRTGNLYLPPNCPGNIPVASKSPVFSCIILRVNALVSELSPGPNMATLGVRFGQKERSRVDNWLKLLFCCLSIRFTSGEHLKYLQIKQAVNQGSI